MTPLDRRRLGALVVAMAYPTLLSYIEFFLLPAPAGDSSQDAERSTALKIAFGVGKTIQFTFPLFFIFLFDRQRWQPARPTTRGLGLSLAFGTTVALGIFGLYFLALKPLGVFGSTPAKIKHWLDLLHLGTPAGFLFMATFISVLHSYLEEYSWRWFTFGGLALVIPWGWAVLISSLAFMSHHVVVLAYYLPGQFWSVVMPLSLCVACGGAVWAWLYHQTSTIYVPWLSHILIDAAIMIVGYDMLAPYF